MRVGLLVAVVVRGVVGATVLGVSPGSVSRAEVFQASGEHRLVKKIAHQPTILKDHDVVPPGIRRAGPT